MGKYRHLFGLMGSTNVYSESDKPPTKDELNQIWRWKGEKDIQEDDFDATHVKTYEIDEYGEEIKEIEIKETNEE